ncbi:Signal transducer regulating beta-lactamase production, contains metallopeptidase domain [Singulisphaera sp. GP187]|uniref:M56 family metallopeptidase n=1 Tax=Singulisphaera sp. GP187 TaxID=1882752 RepID=UPI00092B828F|nr:M56 family metallopeptidase [Singulisphaera sp. GP187]SIO34877.1 Signal transducer regulating beta-lactamase production, contains metallopeptidase domain [Singulisphaera sp. GP187]
MNDLGLTLAWSAVQVSLLLIPATGLYVVASRRSPASGTWVASLSLGLVVVVSLLTFVPRGGGTTRPIPKTAPSPSVAIAVRGDDSSGELREDEGRGIGGSFAVLRSVWQRLETTAAEPAARCRPWGSALAAVALAGTGVGLLHLMIGLWAVHRCVRRSRPVDAPELNDLIEELRDSLGCRRRVAVREAAELTTPATAGWRRVFVLLPDDWRSWDEPERRAVFAHELAHVCRSDYAMGVVARLALAMHFYHPLVHWLAARLQWEQELAADALGARLAGGRPRYLLSLSRLALRQDGRIPCWPARTFLPAKGNLIRRIAMLRDESVSMDRPWSLPRRGVSALLLLGVTCGVLTLQGPARGDDTDNKVDNAVKAVARESRPDDQVQGEPFDLTYLPEGAQGFMAFRPAATFRRAGMGTYRTMLNLLIAQEWTKAAIAFGFDPAKPGQGPLRVEMFEEVMGLVQITRYRDEKPRWRFTLGDVLSARTTQPVDWMGLCRTFQQVLTEVHEGSRVYYRVKIPALGPDGCLYFPDDRTIVFAGEKRMLQLLRRQTSASPVFAQGKGWDRSLRGLFVAAFDSRDGLLRTASLDDPDHPEVSNLFKDGGLLTFSLDNSDEIRFGGVATLGDTAASESTARAIPTFLKSLRERAGDPGAVASTDKSEERARRMFLDLVTNCRVERDGQSVVLRTSGLGTIADFAALVAAGGF